MEISDAEKEKKIADIEWHANEGYGVSYEQVLWLAFELREALAEIKRLNAGMTGWTNVGDDSDAN